MKRHYVVILNPVAGKGHAVQRIPEIETFFNHHDLDYRIEITKEAGHAVQLAKKYGSRKENLIISAGGDGTANEIINGLMQADAGIDHQPAFAVLAIGRGNDFAFSAGVPQELGLDLENIRKGTLYPMDVGEIKGGDYPEGRYFGNGIGVGFDAIVGFEAAKMEHVHGAAGYAVGALKTLVKYPVAPELEISFDGRTEYIRAAMISVMNGRRMGGAFLMAPNGKMDDGLLDYSMTRQGRRLKLLSGVMDYAKGKQARRDDTFTGRAVHVHIKALSGTLAVHADGETICEKGHELDIRLVPKALKLIKA